MLQRAHGWTLERFFFVCLFFPFRSHKSSRSCSIPPPPPPSFTCWRSMGTMATGNCEPVRGGGEVSQRWLRLAATRLVFSPEAGAALRRWASGAAESQPWQTHTSCSHSCLPSCVCEREYLFVSPEVLSSHPESGTVTP